MDFKKEWQEVLKGIVDLPLELQDIVVQDLVESAKNRIATMKQIAGQTS
jgi:hypothetical protein